MKLSQILSEASYPGNIGAIEVFKFYRKASEDEKETFDNYIKHNDYDDAWELIRSVTGVDLEPMGSIDEQIATVYSNPIKSITVSHSGNEMNYPIIKTKRFDDDTWVLLVHTPQGHQKWIYDETSKKLYHTFGDRNNRVRFIGKLVKIDREERSAA